MSRSTTKTYYKGRKVFVGIDVHKKTYAICAMSGGIVEKTATTPANPIGLTKSLKNWFPGAKINTAYEASFSGFTLHRELQKSGIKNIVINPGSLEVAKVEVVKTDKKDSKKIAEQLSMGRLQGIYIPTIKEESRRQINRVRDQIVKSRTTTANRIRGRLNYLGIDQFSIGRVLGKKALINLLSTINDSERRLGLELLINQWIFLTDQLTTIKKEFERQAKEEEYLQEIYRSAPGVGIVTAQVLANELGDLSLRFKNQKSLFSYIGLVPKEHSSGESIVKGGIHKKGPSRIRKVLIEAAWRAILEDEALAKFYKQKSVQVGKNKAIVAIARKLIGRIRSCFMSEELYCHGYIE